MAQQPKQPTEAGKVVCEYLERYPTTPSRTLARLLRKEQPALFATERTALSMVRYYRGARGKKNRGKVGKRYPRTKQQSDTAHRWGVAIPPAEPSTFEWHELPSNVSRWLIVADIHAPYHDEAAVLTTLRHARGNCDGVLILGDGADSYSLSHWMRDPRRRRFSEEVKHWCEFLDMFSELGTVVWKLGNHEDRLERYLMQHAAELFGLDAVTWQSLCETERRGVVCIPAGHPIRHHELTLIHGHEWGNRFASPVNPARGAFLKAHDCTLEAHSHRTSHHTEHTLRGRPISNWSIGCLCNLHPEYRPLGNKWNHGFAYLTTGSEWRIDNHRIINGEVV